MKRTCTFFPLKVVSVILVGAFSCFANELPVGLSRFNPVGLSLDWKSQGEAFSAYISPPKNLKTIPIIRLQHKKYGFLLTISEVEAEKAELKGFVRQGIAFYAPVKSQQPVFRFHSQTGAGYFYSLHTNTPETSKMKYEGVAFYSCGSKSNNCSVIEQAYIKPVYRYQNTTSGQYLFTIGKETPYMVGVFYFGSFSLGAATVINGTFRVYGRQQDWWGGVVDFYGNEPGIPRNTRNWAGSWPYLKPVIGYYNQQSIDVLKQHVRQASDAGLSFFSFYWYWSNKKNGELFPEALQSFYKAVKQNDFKFNVSFYSHPWDEDMAITPTNASLVISRLVKIFAHKNYLRLPDGRPVFVIGDHSNIRAQDGSKCVDAPCHIRAVNHFLKGLREATMMKMGVSPYIQIQAGALGWDKVEVESISCLIPPIRVEAEMQYPVLNSTVFRPLAGTGKTVSACMFQNFDERPRQDILIHNRATIRYLVGKTDEAFRHNLQTAKKFSDQEYFRTQDPAAHILYLYAWNEWHEGGVLEPNVATGAKDLNIVTDVFQLPRLPSKCLENAMCL